jgi:hypothetical protein
MTCTGILTIPMIEKAIGRCTTATPPENGRLKGDAGLLCDIYGMMIWEKTSQIETKQLEARHREAVEKWAVSEGR